MLLAAWWGAKKDGSVDVRLLMSLMKVVEKKDSIRMGFDNHI